MEVTVKELAAYLEERVPSGMKMENAGWSDNVGLLIGLTERAVTRVLVALDITGQVISEAEALRAQLIISHHPLLFSCRHIVDTDIVGRKIIRLISSGISAICMHTNLDVAEGGVNTCLGESLGLGKMEVMETHGVDKNGVPYGLGRIGEMAAPVSFDLFLGRVKTALHAGGLRYVYGGRDVCRVAVSGGSDASDLAALAARGCDTLVTSDIKYHKFLEAEERGINLIDAGHFPTENVVCPMIREMVLLKYPQLQVSISKRHGQIEKYY